MTPYYPTDISYVYGRDQVRTVASIVYKITAISGLINPGTTGITTTTGLYTFDIIPSYQIIKRWFISLPRPVSPPKRWRWFDIFRIYYPQIALVGNTYCEKRHYRNRYGHSLIQKRRQKRRIFNQELRLA